MHKYTTFIVALFIIENTQMSINKGQVEEAMVYSHTMEYYAAVNEDYNHSPLFVLL